MKKTLVLILAMIALSGCAAISDLMAKNRMDVDGDKIPRPDDCDDHDPKIGIRIWFHDLDKDGRGAGEKIVVCDQPLETTITNDDCDDTHASVYPGAPELCDGLDNDCNGLTDDDPIDQKEWFENLDGDTYGNPLVKKVGCLQPEHTVEDQTDCDDNNKDIHPNAVEQCNAIDDNCNSQTDEGFDVGVSCDGNDADQCKNGTRTCRPDHFGAECINETATGILEVCNGLDDNCDGETDEGCDVDKDTYCSLDSTILPGAICKPGDCNDNKSSTHPGAEEICDGIDNNCDGKTDEWCDADKDGYCQLAASVTEGSLCVPGDCNDGNKNIHPGVAEICDNNVDENCDGITDNAAGAKPYYEDKDKDGYGTINTSVFKCTPSDGYVTDKTDCDDSAISIHPGAPEICNDNIDNDCNGVTDTDAKEVLWYKDSDGDKYGDLKVTKLACSPPTGFVENALDCLDSNPNVHPGAAEVCNNGIDDNCDGSVNQCVISGTLSVSAADVTLFGTEFNAGAGYAIATGDIGGDGQQEIFIATSTGQNSKGIVYLHHFTMSGNIPLSNSPTLLSQVTGDQFGFSLASGCDINNDGKDDLIVGAPSSSIGPAKSGSVYIYSGKSNNEVVLTAKLNGIMPNEAFGMSVACIPDINGDGFDEVLVGAPQNQFTGNGAGAAYLFYGPVVKDTSADKADVIFYGNPDDSFGKSVSHAGDTDKNGFGDIIIGAPNRSSGQKPGVGAVCLFLTPFSTKIIKTDSSDAQFIGESAEDSAGHALSSIGDIDSDGFSDILISAPHKTISGGQNTGSTYLQKGPFKGSIDLGLSFARYDGIAANAQSGLSISGSGDVDGDGIHDILIGVPYAEISKGLSFLSYSAIAGTHSLDKISSATFQGLSNEDQLGKALALSYINNDKFADVIICARYADTPDKNTGACYIFFGKGL